MAATAARRALGEHDGQTGQCNMDELQGLLHERVRATDDDVHAPCVRSR
jgi:hypothetical protein